MLLISIQQLVGVRPLQCNASRADIVFVVLLIAVVVVVAVVVSLILIVVAVGDPEPRVAISFYKNGCVFFSLTRVTFRL